MAHPSLIVSKVSYASEQLLMLFFFLKLKVLEFSFKLCFDLNKNVMDTSND